MSIEVIITIVGLTVAGLAAVLGIWVERDPKKPPRYAYALSLLILLATSVGMFQTYMDAKENEKMESDMARMLAMLDKIASEHGDDIPELNDMVKTEIAAQSRSNPNVVTKVAQRVSDDGRDPAAMLARSLPAAEVQDLQRRGRLNVASPAVALRPGAPAPGGSGASPARMMIRLPGANAAGSGEAPAAAPEAEGSAEAAPAASASAPLPIRLGAPAGSGGGRIRLPGRPGGDKPAAGGDKPAPAAGGDKPKPPGGRTPRMGGN